MLAAVNKAMMKQRTDHSAIYTHAQCDSTYTRACTHPSGGRAGTVSDSTSLLSSCSAAFCRYADNHYRGCRDTVTAIKQLTEPISGVMEAAPAAIGR